MIKEINNPLPSYDIIYSEKELKKIIKEKFDIDIKILAKMLAEKMNIKETLAEEIIMAFFEEIKRIMAEGKIASLCGFGKFYLAGPNERWMKAGKVGKSPKIYPRMKCPDGLKIKLSKMRKAIKGE